jgi:hypothetical protein
MEELRKAAEAEGVAINQLINVAVAEKVSRLRTEEYFKGRAQRADRSATLKILEKAGKGNPPIEGDELPADWARQPKAQISKKRPRTLGRSRNNKQKTSR